MKYSYFKTLQAGRHAAGTADKESWTTKSDATTGPQRRPGQGSIQTALGQIGFALPGTITIRTPAAASRPLRLRSRPPCAARPLLQWTWTVHGKTVTRLLSPAQYQAYATLFATPAGAAR